MEFIRINKKEGVFDAEKLINVLQALEKFTAVRDHDSDGSAFKVDGVRGTNVVGTAGDFVGSQQVDTSDRETDVGDSDSLQIENQINRMKRLSEKHFVSFSAQREKYLGN